MNWVGKMFSSLHNMLKLLFFRVELLLELKWNMHLIQNVSLPAYANMLKYLTQFLFSLLSRKMEKPDGFFLHCTQCLGFSLPYWCEYVGCHVEFLLDTHKCFCVPKEGSSFSSYSILYVSPVAPPPTEGPSKIMWIAVWWLPREG